MAHIVHKFERRLRQLEELAPKTYKITLQSLLNIHKVGLVFVCLFVCLLVCCL